MKMVVWDTEGDSLVPDKFWCLNYAVCHEDEVNHGVLYDYSDIRGFFKKYPDYFYVAHNCRRWDLPHLERVVGVTPPENVIDTLFLSQALFLNRKSYSLESFGVDYSIPKIQIEDWKGLSLDDYTLRCKRDVDINVKLIQDLISKGRQLYDSPEDFIRFLKYLDFKAKAAQLAEASGWKLDEKGCQESLSELEGLLEEKTEELKKALPLIPIMKVKEKPKVLRKANGELSSAGVAWVKLLKENSLHEEAEAIIKGEDLYYTGQNFKRSIRCIEYCSGHKEPNPQSVSQIKDWLFTLGWKPQIYKEVVNSEGEKHKVPQINVSSGVVCKSILSLADEHPAVSSLEGIGVLKHRIGLLKGFLRDVKDGRLHARVAGLTNTLRFRHAEIVNLPASDRLYAGGIRRSLIADEGSVLCGSDMSSLEDRTKQHFMYRYDPKYVKEMDTPEFDPHIDLAVLAGMMTKEEGDDYKKKKLEGKETPKHLDKIRSTAKNANYACVYGAFPSKIAATAGITLKEAERLHEIYWKRNWSVLETAKAQTVKELAGPSGKGELWLFNPISKFWYSLRDRKDIFSTLNQGTGTYCFDMWVSIILNQRPQITGQFHDEIILSVPEGRQNDIEEILRDAIKKLNSILKLNKPLDISVQFGYTYADIH